MPRPEKYPLSHLAIDQHQEFHFPTQSGDDVRHAMQEAVKIGTAARARKRSGTAKYSTSVIHESKRIVVRVRRVA